ncbi:MAG: metal-dependent hydrolase [bacterium]
MSTPIAHSLTGINVYLVSKNKNTINNRLLILYCLIVSNLPDIDFFCITTNGIKWSPLYHHQVTHSIIFMLILSLIAWLTGGQRLGIITLWCLGLHNLIDYFTFDTIPPKGIMLLYPFSKQYFISPVTFWCGSEHQTLGDTVSFISLISMGYDLITVGLITFIVIISKRIYELRREN